MASDVADMANSRVAVVLAAKSEQALHNAAAKLCQQEIKHHVWIEQPEGIATAIATIPIRKSFARAAKVLGKLKLLK